MNQIISKEEVQTHEVIESIQDQLSDLRTAKTVILVLQIVNIILTFYLVHNI